MNKPRFLLDAGPLVAYFHPRDQFHDWARETFTLESDAFVTCEPALVEAFYLLAKYPNGPDLLAEFCASDALQINFRLLDNMKPIRQLLQKYRDLPMSLADACLVLLVEQHPDAAVITTDRDFLLYRTRSRRQIRLLAPFS